MTVNTKQFPNIQRGEFSNREAVLQKNGENIMERACEKRGKY